MESRQCQIEERLVSLQKGVEGKLDALLSLAKTD
jgi:hypothetical protein